MWTLHLCTIMSLAAVAYSSWIQSEALSQRPIHQQRRAFLTSGIISVSATLAAPSISQATTDCFQDCFKNCLLVAPKDKGYCTDNCRDYCDQPDREDGLSGSVSSVKGETGILGFGTVPKGEDKPPGIRLPGLDFTSGSGKKLIGY